jgi:hypothetical protein
MLILEPYELRPRRATEPVERPRKTTGFAAKLRDYRAFVIPRSGAQPSKNGPSKTLQKRQRSSQTEIRSRTTAGNELQKLKRYLVSHDAEEPPGGVDIDVSIGMLQIQKKSRYPYPEKGFDTRR